MSGILQHIRESSKIVDIDRLKLLGSNISVVFEDRTTAVYATFLLFILALGIFGPTLAPYEYNVPQYSEDGDILRGSDPSLAHPLGTTTNAYDILSRVLVGARPTVITGLLGGGLIISIALLIGVVSGYVGGRVDNLLMRFTDLIYGVPLIPFALVIIAFLDIGFITSIIVIGCILWRGPARSLRSQVLQIKERSFVTSAKTTGASTPRIIVSHIIPNVASMAIFFFALGIGQTILVQAALAFLGVSNPGVPSWGIMIRNAYSSGQLVSLWQWSLAPGLLLSGTVLSVIMVGRSIEDLTGVSEADKMEVE